MASIAAGVQAVETPADPVNLAAFRHFLYLLLSDCLLQVPSPGTLSLPRNPEWRKLAPTLLGVSLPDLWSDLAKEPNSRVLTAEYAALFVIPGPRHTCPYETYYRERYRRNGGHSLGPGYVSLQVQRAYAQWGVRCDLKTGELPDHAGVELRFMSLLVAAEYGSRKTGNEGSVEAAVRAQMDFLNEHISQWFPAWLDCVFQRAHQSFYRSLALVLGHFLEMEKTSVKETGRSATLKPGLYPELS